MSEPPTWYWSLLQWLQGSHCATLATALSCQLALSLSCALHCCGRRYLKPEQLSNAPWHAGSGGSRSETRRESQALKIISTSIGKIMTVKVITLITITIRIPRIVLTDINKTQGQEQQYPPPPPPPPIDYIVPIMAGIEYWGLGGFTIRGRGAISFHQDSIRWHINSRNIAREMHRQGTKKAALRLRGGAQNQPFKSQSLKP